MLHRSRRSTHALAGLAATAALLLLHPDGGRAEKSPLRTCTDNAWSEYNDCLMETDSSFFRKGCDFDFMLTYEACQIKHWRDTLGV